MRNQPNELRRDLLSTLGLNPFIGTVSSPRAQMFSSHAGQKLVVAEGTERYIQTGMEIEFAKYTFSIKMPVDATILRTIDRYSKTIDRDSINMNSQTVVIYEDDKTKEIGMLSIPTYCSYHQHFGFEYKATPAINSLVKGAKIPKDTILLDSPAVSEKGNYKYGIELNMAFMSHPSVSEDGIMISRDVLPRFAFKTYETRVVEWGSKRFPINLYGTPDNFKAFPDIGDYVRDDGMLMALRTYESALAPVEQSIHDVMEVDHIFDKATYVMGPGGRIVDIKIYSADSEINDNATEMDRQVLKYQKATTSFHQKIVAEYRKLKKEKGDSLQLTPLFHRQVVDSLAYIGEDNETPRIQKLYRKAPIDEYRIEFIIEYNNIPREGFKFTDTHGGKGVICKIAEPHEMPIDEAGNRADIVMDGNSTINRMNIGRLYEQYINSASRDVAKKLSLDLNIKQGDIHTKTKMENIFHENREVFEKAYKYLMGYYHIVSPKMCEWLMDVEDEVKIDHLASVIRTHIYIYLPPENEPEFVDIVKQLELHYQPTYGKVSYIGNSGNTVVTTDNVRIGSVYILLLEKTGDDWASVSSGKLQHFGILAQLTKTDKYSQPTRMQPVRAIGESEARIFVSYCGQEAMAEIMDRNNTPSTHREIVKNILSAEKPTNIPNVIDRKKFPLGGSKPINIVNHTLLCTGIRFVYNSTKVAKT